MNISFCIIALMSIVVLYGLVWIFLTAWLFIDNIVQVYEKTEARSKTVQPPTIRYYCSVCDGCDVHCVLPWFDCKNTPKSCILDSRNSEASWHFEGEMKVVIMENNTESEGKDDK